MKDRWENSEPCHEERTWGRFCYFWFVKTAKCVLKTEKCVKNKQSRKIIEQSNEVKGVFKRLNKDSINYFQVFKLTRPASFQKPKVSQWCSQPDTLTVKKIYILKAVLGKLIINLIYFLEDIFLTIVLFHIVSSSAFFLCSKTSS